MWVSRNGDITNLLIGGFQRFHSLFTQHRDVLMYAIAIIELVAKLRPKETRVRMAEAEIAGLANVSRWFAHESRLAAWVLSLTEVLAWYDNKVLVKFCLDRKEKTWRLMVKATGSGPKNTRRHYVTFVECATAAECVQIFAAQVKSHNIAWVEDRYPPDMAS